MPSGRRMGWTRYQKGDGEANVVLESVSDFTCEETSELDFLIEFEVVVLGERGQFELFLEVGSHFGGS